ncbi:MAG: hypothetical protein HY741_29620 [Chloroflexi bacterium]|nr:hypothetical protein [Chloroflexota bacterium]
MLNKVSLVYNHPWLAPGRDALNLVIGDDLDAALSAALFLRAHPNAKIIGVYSKYTTVYYSAACAWNEVLNAVWLDLDIYHAQCRSLGHHIVRVNARDPLPGFKSSLNLNDLWGKALQKNFDEKYPLGTIHFLMWLYNVEIPSTPDADLLLWLADSAYINAQARAYRKRWVNQQTAWVEREGFKWNVKGWLHGAIQVKSLQQTFEQVNTLAFEERMRAFQQTLDAQGFHQGAGQVASHHLKLFGYQCQPDGAVGAYVLRLLEFVSQQTGWKYAPAQVEPLKHLQSKTGKRVAEKLARVQAQGLANFLETHNVFSYVFTHFDTINYTTGLTEHCGERSLRA